MCVYCLAPPKDSLEYSKFIYGPNFGPNLSQTVGLEGQKPAKKTLLNQRFSATLR